MFGRKKQKQEIQDLIDEHLNNMKSLRKEMEKYNEDKDSFDTDVAEIGVMLTDFIKSKKSLDK